MGSSQNSTRDLAATAWAMATGCRSPPERLRGLFLTTEAVVADKREKAAAATAGHGGDMDF